MTITEIIAPDGTLLLAERIPKRAAYVVIYRDEAGDWQVLSTHTTRRLARLASNRSRHIAEGCEHPVVPIPGRETGTSGYPQGDE